MADFSSQIGNITGMLKTGGFWIVVAVAVAIFLLFFFLMIGKKRKLKYNCLELVPYGNGKVGMNQMKCGIFKSKTTFFGLIDHGSEHLMKTSDGRIVQKARTSHLHDIFGKKGLICVRKANDPKILVPISRVQFDNLKGLFEIAPANFRDASVSIVREATKETQGWADKYLPYIMLGAIVIFFIISMVLSIQLINRAVDKSMEIRTMDCSNMRNSGAGTSP